MRATDGLGNAESSLAVSDPQFLCPSVTGPHPNPLPGRGDDDACRLPSAAIIALMPQLGVNIDHVATVRQARRTYEPDPVWAAALAELGGADGITIHLREDRRHISDRDLRILRQTVSVKLNLEMACAERNPRHRLRGEARPGYAGARTDAKKSPPKAAWTSAASATAWPDRRSASAGRHLGQPVPRSRSAADRGGGPAGGRRRRAAHRPIRLGRGRRSQQERA